MELENGGATLEAILTVTQNVKQNYITVKFYF